MSVQAQVFIRNAMEDSSSYALARVLVKNSSHNLVAAVIADISTISRSVFLVTDGVVGTTAVIGPTTVVVADTMLNALSTGDLWNTAYDFGGFAGFNWIDTVPATAFPTGGATYDLRYTFTSASSLTFFLVFRVVTIAN